MKYPQLSLDEVEGPKAVIETTMGTITAQLFPKYAPKTVENFVKLAEKNYYDDVIFHRVIPDFMIQGGDPTGTGRGGESIYGHPFEDEFSEELFNFTGALSMANAGPNTNGSQFFIVTNEHVPENMIDQMKAVGTHKRLLIITKNMVVHRGLTFITPYLAKCYPGWMLSKRSARLSGMRWISLRKTLLLKQLRLKKRSNKKG